MIKINWNLKNPIKLSISAGGDGDKTNGGADEISKIDTSRDGNQTYFKATSLKDLNKKKQLQTSWDDSSMSETTSTDGDEKSSQNLLFRSQTVKCKPNRWKRSPILGLNEEKIEKEIEAEV